jgi:hypothetical protein
MSRRSIVVPLTACVFFVVLLGSGRLVRAHVVAKHPSVQAGADRYGGDNPGPFGVEFGVEPPAAGTTKFPCLVAVRSLLTGERILLEKFPADPGKETKFRKSSQGLDVEVEVTIGAGGSSAAYTITVSSTKAHLSWGIYGARIKLRN